MNMFLEIQEARHKARKQKGEPPQHYNYNAPRKRQGFTRRRKTPAYSPKFKRAAVHFDFPRLTAYPYDPALGV